MSRTAKSIEELSQILKVSVREIYRWKRQGMPGENKRYPVDEIIEWRAKYIRPEPAQMAGTDKRPNKEKQPQSIAELTLEEARLKCDIQLERKRELIHKRKLRERNILPRKEYEEFLRDVVTVTRDAIQALPSQLAKVGATPQQQGSIYAETERIVRGALQQAEEMLAKKGDAFE